MCNMLPITYINRVTPSSPPWRDVNTHLIYNLQSAVTRGMDQHLEARYHKTHVSLSMRNSSALILTKFSIWALQWVRNLGRIYDAYVLSDASVYKMRLVTMAMFQVEVLWVVTPCRVMVGMLWYPTTTLHGVTTQKTSTWNIVLCAPFLCRFQQNVRGCIQKFPNWPPGARTANGTALCH